MKINLFKDEFGNKFTHGTVISQSLPSYDELQIEYNKVIQLGRDFGFDPAVPYSVSQVITHAKYLQEERARLLFENM